MARKRMIDPGIWTDDGFMALSLAERQLWFGLISHADDDGRGTAEPRGLRAKVFPADGMTDEDVAAMCDVLAKRMRVRFYTTDGTRYYQLDRWRNHQFIKDRKPSTLPPPPEETGVGPGADRERTGSGPASDRDPPPMNEGMKEGKERRTGTGPAPAPTPRSWTMDWYREFTRRTARALEPGPEAYAAAAKAWKRAKPADLLATVPRYFEHPFWFTAPKRGTTREWSFGNYLAHLEDVISSLGSGAAPPKAAPTKILRCPNGHAYLPGQTCRECGWKEGSDADDF